MGAVALKVYTNPGSIRAVNARVLKDPLCAGVRGADGETRRVIARKSVISREAKGETRFVPLAMILSPRIADAILLLRAEVYFVPLADD